jgi:hypothetical protein
MIMMMIELWCGFLLLHSLLTLLCVWMNMNMNLIVGIGYWFWVHLVVVWFIRNEIYDDELEGKGFLWDQNMGKNLWCPNNVVKRERVN